MVRFPSGSYFWAKSKPRWFSQSASVWVRIQEWVDWLRHTLASDREEDYAAWLLDVSGNEILDKLLVVT